MERLIVCCSSTDHSVCQNRRGELRREGLRLCLVAGFEAVAQDRSFRLPYMSEWRSGVQTADRDMTRPA